MSRGVPTSRAAATLMLLMALVGVGCSFGGGTDSAGGSPGSSTGNASGAAGESSGAAGSTGVNPTTGSGGDTVITAGSGGSSGGAGGATGAPPDGGAQTGAGGSETGAAGSVGTGAAGTTGGAGTTGAAGAGSACLVTIDAIPPSSLFSLVAGPASTVQLEASVSGYAGAPKWEWSVQLIADVTSVSTDLPVTPLDDTGARVEVPLPTSGKLAVRALIDGAPSCSRPPQQFTVNGPQTPSFVFRVTPPSGSRLPVSESVLSATAIAATTHTIDLGDGSSADVVSLAPVDAQGFPLPSFIRVNSPSFTFDLEAYTGQGPFIEPLMPDVIYDVLVVPDAELAPLLVSGTLAALQGLGPTVAPGLPVSGTAVDGGGKPVVGARVILRDEHQVPSTIGVTAADGTFSLSARDGMLSAEIVPPAGSGLPTALVGSSVLLLAEEMNLALTMTWSPLATGDLSVTVRAPGGGALVQGARVRADATGDLSSVGTLRVDAPGVSVVDAELTATGSVEAAGTTDAQGVAHLGTLPAGAYHLTVSPPDGVAAAVTMSDVTLPATGLSAQVPLGATVALTGTLLPSGATAGALVTAIDQGVLASSTVPSAVAAADGTYTLALSPGRSYELLVQPAAGRMLGASVVSIVTPGASAAARSDVVPAGVAWSGLVTGAGRPVAGAMVQVFCAPPACLDSSLAVAQGTTRADGTLSLVLPSPPPSP